jgi:hypothetical protein
MLFGFVLGIGGRADRGQCFIPLAFGVESPSGRDLPFVMPIEKSELSFSSRKLKHVSKAYVY